MPDSRPVFDATGKSVLAVYRTVELGGVERLFRFDRAEGKYLMEGGADG